MSILLMSEVKRKKPHKRLLLDGLPSPSLNITSEKQLEQSVAKILEGLSDFGQVVLMKQRWEEIKKLQLTKPIIE
jgi:hypothetical protein